MTSATYLNWAALWRYYQGKTIDLMWLNTVLWHKVAKAKKFHRGNIIVPVHAQGSKQCLDWLGSWPVNLSSCQSCWPVIFDHIENEIVQLFQFLSVCCESLCIVALWSEIQGEIQLEPLFTISALDIGVHAVPVTKLKIFTLLLDKQRLFNFWAYITTVLVHGPLF